MAAFSRPQYGILAINAGSSSIKFALFEAQPPLLRLMEGQVERIGLPGSRADYVRQAMRDKLIEHKQYITEHGEDLPGIRKRIWPGARR
jgi:acetate kinase